MADPKDDLEEAEMWGQELDGGDAPIEGIDRETLRKAMSLNPNMKKKFGSTGKIIQSLEKASAARPIAGSNAEPQQRVAEMNLAEGVGHYKQKYADESKKLHEELKRIQQQIKDLAPSIQDRLIDLFMQHDPNMNTAYTQEILRIEGQFLNTVGFSVRRVIEKQMQGKKR